MWRALLAACLLATLSVACADEDLLPTPTPVATPRPTAGPKTAVTPVPKVVATAQAKGAPTPIPTAGPAIPSRLLAPIDFPANLAVVTQNVTCWGCESELDSITRAYRDPSGHLRVETLLAMRTTADSSTTFLWRTQAQGRDGVAVTECAGADCRLLLGVGNYTRPLQSVRFSSRRSVDGGVTWSSTPTAPGKGALVYDFAGDELLLQQPWVADAPTSSLRGAYFLFPSGLEVQPPLGLADRSLSAPGVQAVSAGRSPESARDYLWHYTVRGPVFQEDRLAWDSRLRAEAEGRPVEGREPFPSDLPGFPSVTWAPFGQAMVVWSERSPGGGRWGVSSRMPGDPLVRYAYDGLAGPGAWLLDELAFPPLPRFVVSTSTADSAASERAASRGWPLQLVRLDSATGDVQPYLAPELEGVKLAWVLLAYQGPFARAIRGDACTEVRSGPSTAAPVLECAASGVLFQRTAPPTVDGAWLGVTSPAGVTGWAETRHLEW